MIAIIEKNVPFSSLKPGDHFLTNYSMRRLRGMKTTPLQVDEAASHGGRVPFRNVVIIDDFQQYGDIGTHLFVKDEQCVDKVARESWDEKA